MSDNMDEPTSSDERERIYATPEEKPFYRAMHEHPFPSKARGDARAVFADWLEERGECERAKEQRNMARINYEGVSCE